MDRVHLVSPVGDGGIVTVDVVAVVAVAAGAVIAVGSAAALIAAISAPVDPHVGKGGVSAATEGHW